MTAKKNNALPTDVGETKTDIVLENNDSQVPEEETSDVGVCETETVKETPSPGYEEFGEPPKTDLEAQNEDVEASGNQEKNAPIPKTEFGDTGEATTQVTEGVEIIGESETDTGPHQEDVHPGREFSENNQVLETDREIDEGISTGEIDSKETTKTDSEITEKPLNAMENSGEEEETVKPKKKSGSLEVAKAKEEAVEDINPEKKKKKRVKKSETQETETVVTEKTQEDVSVAKKVAKKQTLVKPMRDVVTIDNERRVETEEDKAQNDLLDLLESLKGGRFLTGVIQGVESTENGNESFAVIYHGVFKVIIPALELVEEPNDYRGLNPKEVQKYLLSKRLGTEIDYMVKGIDKESGVAVASRKDAMRVKRKLYYFGKDRDGNNLLYPDVCAEARVVSVIRAGIFVEVFGVETYIPLKQLSYQRLMDAKLDYQTGQRIIVKILEIDKTDPQNIKIKASVKKARENPYEKVARKYSVDNCYVGTVSLVNESGVFVDLGEGIDCLCYYPKRGRPPRGARVSVRILEINPTTNRLWGVIVHIAMPR